MTRVPDQQQPLRRPSAACAEPIHAQPPMNFGSRSVVVASFETYPQSGGGLIQTYFSDLLKRIPRITVLKADLLKRIPSF